MNMPIRIFVISRTLFSAGLDSAGAAVLIAGDYLSIRVAKQYNIPDGDILDRPTRELLYSGQGVNPDWKLVQRLSWCHCITS